MPDHAFDATKPHVSRVYDYLLGGKDTFAADGDLRDPAGILGHPVLQMAAAGVGRKA